MPQKSGLGRGLGALIPGGENVLTENGVMLVSVDLVFPNPRQPRSMKPRDHLGHGRGRHAKLSGKTTNGDAARGE